MLDANGHIDDLEHRRRAHQGLHAPSEIIGRHFSVFYPPEAKESGWPEHELQVAAAKGASQDEGWRLRKDGSPFWASVIITALRDEDGRLLGFAKVTRDLTERKRAEALERASQQREELLEAERTRADGRAARHPHQGRVPGHALARAAHAAERHPRLDAGAARSAAAVEAGRPGTRASR